MSSNHLTFSSSASPPGSRLSRCSSVSNSFPLRVKLMLRRSIFRGRRGHRVQHFQRAHQAWRGDSGPIQARKPVLRGGWHAGEQSRENAFVPLKPYRMFSTPSEIRPASSPTLMHPSPGPSSLPSFSTSRSSVLRSRPTSRMCKWTPANSLRQ